ncbi:DUF1801 domain-containing protein [Paenibacillus sp. LMG 31459]|jgi:hypothetical protein|uniref:DUF1801 domain-containing protein n=1 Tax=Paenibacillus phytohabitans TaxID=2654978 RepID=A0ABX1YLL3_9BACL|nr:MULTISPECIES: DUF1801 domain-containing protein [Paenibacillus]NOU81942.1 DUF1801 domain-containing protein [Paenibacillus phytohabitans]OMF26915.1 hypothetical protein BK132_18390 [Paenibacillus sp. FSL H8-0259]
MNEEVTNFIAQIKVPWQAEICSKLRQVIHETVPDVTERIQYGKPHFLKNGKYAAVISTAKGWVSFSIFNAAALEVPEGQFEAGSGDRLTTKLTEGKTVDYELLSSLLKQASDSL